MLFKNLAGQGRRPLLWATLGFIILIAAPDARAQTPASAEAYANRGAALLLQGRGDEARRDLERSERLAEGSKGAGRKGGKGAKRPRPRDE